MYLQTDASEPGGKSGKISQLRKIAELSEGSEFDYFKRSLLQPFLIERVSDTEGNRQVQQACTASVTANNG